MYDAMEKDGCTGIMGGTRVKGIEWQGQRRSWFTGFCSVESDLNSSATVRSYVSNFCMVLITRILYTLVEF